MSRMKCEVRKVTHALHLDVNTLLYDTEILRIIKMSDKSNGERIETDKRKDDMESRSRPDTAVNDKFF